MIFSCGRLNRIRYLSYSFILLFFLMIVGLCVRAVLSHYCNIVTVQQLWPYFSFIGIGIYLVMKLWFIKRRCNDIGYSLFSYITFVSISLILLFWPNIAGMLGLVDKSVAMIEMPLGYKLSVALSFIISVMMLTGTAIIISFYRGTAGANRYGVEVPQENNYFTVVTSVMYVLLCSLLITKWLLAVIHHIQV